MRLIINHRVLSDMEKENKEIPFGAKDSELYKFEYTIPEGYEARIENGKVIVTKKDSEDERIRKELIEYLTHRSEVTGFIDEDKDCKRWIAYLEKQKEQKPVHTEDEKDFLEKEVKAFLCNYDKEFDDDAPTYDIAEHFYQLGKNSQKPAEWSDSVAKEMFIKALERAVKQTKKGYELTDCDKNSWWEDFKAYSGIRPAEWSEEDERIMNNCIEYIKASCLNTNDLCECIDWFESLRPQPHWKPSEVQIEALENSTALNEEQGAHLYSLLCDLKKLL